MKIRKIGVEEKVNKEERDNILELLNTPWSWNGWRLEDASENHKRDRKIVMAEVNQPVLLFNFASGDIPRDKDIVIPVVKQNGRRLSLHQRIFRKTLIL